MTFCINTSKHEKSYIELLLQSLLNGIDVNLHDILVFVDSDNENTTEMLIQQKELFPNLTIVKNNGTPVGYAGNSNWMFNHAKTEIVSYLQSDQIVGLEYDKRILSHLTDNMILSSTRVEPPIHAPHDNSITYVRDFGLTPDTFDYSSFIHFSEQVKNSTKLTNYFFAPFTMYKNVWSKIGGYDCSFLKSREDSDIALRFCLNNTKLVQCWDASVYHFTCTSSRSWALKENRNKNINEENDKIELARFVNKWHTFTHPSSRSELESYIQKYPDVTDKIICTTNPPIDESKLTIIL